MLTVPLYKTSYFMALTIYSSNHVKFLQTPQIKLHSKTGRIRHKKHKQQIFVRSRWKHSSIQSENELKNKMKLTESTLYERWWVVTPCIALLMTHPLDQTSHLTACRLKTLWQARTLRWIGIVNLSLYTGLFVLYTVAVLSR